jgi:hypothetical protein
MPQKLHHSIIAEQMAQAEAMKAKCHVTAPVQSTGITARDLAECLVSGMPLPKPGEKFIPGSVFKLNDPETAALYRMMELLGAPFPVALPLIPEKYCEERADIFLNFLQYIGETHKLFAKYHNGEKPVHDDVVHRVAFAFTVRKPKELGGIALESLFKESKAEVRGTKHKVWTPILRIIRDYFIEKGFGWRDELLRCENTWKAEMRYATKHGIEPRKILFPSYHASKAKRVEAERKAEEEQKKATEKAERDRQFAIEEEQKKQGTFVPIYHMQSAEDGKKFAESKGFFDMFAKYGRLHLLIPHKIFVENYLQTQRRVPEDFFDVVEIFVRQIASGGVEEQEKEDFKELINYLNECGINRENRTLKCNAGVA